MAYCQLLMSSRCLFASVLRYASAFSSALCAAALPRASKHPAALAQLLSAHAGPVARPRAALTAA